MMKKLTIILFLAALAFGGDVKPKDFDAYLKSFNVQETADMKIKSVDMLELIKSGEAVLIDVRFAEEFKA
jgi:hypothetical protein